MQTLKTGTRQIMSRDVDTASVVSEMLSEIERDKMDAVRRYSQRFDNWNPPNFELSRVQVEEAIARVPPQVIADTDVCQGRVRKFAQAQLETLRPLQVEMEPGIVLGHRHIPVGSVGAYIPGGRYPMFGSAQMSIIPARVAGVKQVITCTPPLRDGGYYPATINAVKKAGADRIFVLGGVQAMALMAFGLQDIPAVDMLCGAGNKYVVEAKRQLFGRCGIDLLAGPTEILVIADDSADPALVACDLLGQAEHDPNSGVCLIALDRKTAQDSMAEVERQLQDLPTRDVAAVAWEENGMVWVAEDEEQAAQISDDYAPEHLELHVENPAWLADRLTNYGSLFVGEETTVAYGDKSIGTNHILPTGRAARYSGGLWVGKFLKTCTYQRMSPAASAALGEITERQCEIENMSGHALTARVRIDRYTNQ